MPAAPRPRPHPGLEVHGCAGDFLERFDSGPVSPGPLHLVAIACLDFQSSHSGVSDPILSPDGATVARWHEGTPAPIEIARIEGERVDIPNRVSFRDFTALSNAHGSPDALAWSGDSRTLWSVRQPTVSPSGFALGGLEPIAIGRDGTMHALPPLRHLAGPLDGLQWVGGEGRALAQFGARGGYYRPEHDDPAPTFAIVDAARGRVLASFPARSVAALRARIDAHGLRVAGATATILPDGRIRAVIQFGQWGERPRDAGPGWEPIIHPPLWLSWTQGERPRVRPSPYPGERFNHLTFTPDGAKLLLLRPLQPDDVQIECWVPPCPQRPPPRPVTGPIAELLQASTGRVLWRLSARADRSWNQHAAVSGDGRFALISLPPDGDRLPIALVDMRSGRILQTLAPAQSGSYRYGMGFTADGRRAWISVHTTMRFYRIGRR